MVEKCPGCFHPVDVHEDLSVEKDGSNCCCFADCGDGETHDMHKCCSCQLNLDEMKLYKALLDIRAKFHGLSAAVGLNLKGEGELSLPNVLALLREGSKMTQQVICDQGFEPKIAAENG